MFAGHRTGSADKGNTRSVLRKRPRLNGNSDQKDTGAPRTGITVYIDKTGTLLPLLPLLRPER